MSIILTKQNPTRLGGMMIIAGTAIGAGMLANPTATSGVWFVGSVLTLFYVWWCMYLSGLMLLEATLHFPQGASFHTVVRGLLGPRWSALTGLSVAFVLYSLTYAYIFVGGGLTQSSLLTVTEWVSGRPLAISREFSSVVFLLVLAIPIWSSTKLVGHFSTVLISGMLISFFLSNGSLLHSVTLEVLFDRSTHESQHYWRYVWAALPVCLASFGFHGNVPSLVSYYNKESKPVARSILWGSLLALGVYLLWQLAVQGNLPRGEFAPVIAEGGDVTALLAALGQYVTTDAVARFLNAFAFMAIASSFLGVTLGLFDYLRDLFTFTDTPLGRLKTASVTYFPPLLACLFFPTGFVKVMGYVGLMAAIWAVLVPALLVKAARQKFTEPYGYRVQGGMWLVYFVMLFALIVFSVQVLLQMNLIPEFIG
ncbi:aromatic amino acid transporter [Denitrificimonas sp. JX-1]|uniref:Aromatic amino acid permease n=1 Tax=Denitrificimonas halotolerans TaxID=3098930 RepID=A0ABU5GQ15_9GAMM|nr:aromatic amino acid transporter [Denitrificimonas sp. JX-1]MDY7218854.1 aromatic amino acid transporter [Denitrificimonas sp. JX-1]